MNRALWQKAIRDARLQLIVSSVLLVLFGWLFVWLMSLIPTVMIKDFMKQLLPKTAEALLGVPIDQMATFNGRLTMLYFHVITLLVCIGWAIGRGSDVVSGEITRGTMDLLLSLPIRRVEVVAVSAVVAAVGAVVLAASVWVGTWIGLAMTNPPQEMEPAQWLPFAVSGAASSATGPMREQAPPRQATVELSKFWPGVGNLAAMTFCLAGLTALLSSWDHARWRTIWLAGGLFIVSFAVKMVARLWEPGAWMLYLSFLTPFDPQQLILQHDPAAAGLAWRYDGILLLIGLCGYAAAAAVFARRDIPAAY
jgi:ABC-2 type transport system permease protein